jgi:hypothetical protein
VTHCGLEAPRACPTTFGKNEKGGMPEDEFENYIMHSILPLLPDCHDIPNKRVLLKMDMGPVQNNDDLLVKLKSHGFFLLPSVPNATYVM